MDESCLTLVDDDSAEEFGFDALPITNLGVADSRDVDLLYVLNKVSESIEALDGETIDKIEHRDVINRDNSGNILNGYEIDVSDYPFDVEITNVGEKFNTANVLEVTGSDKSKSSDVKNKENNNDIIALDIDEADSKDDNVIDYKKDTQTGTAQPDNMTVLDENTTKSDVIVLDGNKTDSESSIILNEEELKKITENLESENLKGDKTITNSHNVTLLDDNTSDSENTIILDDEELNTIENTLNSTVIDVDNDCSIVEVSNSTAKKKNLEYDEVFKEDTLLTQLIEKCLNMENADGMSRIINRTVLPIYKDTDENYKKSDDFRKIISKTIMNLDIEPAKKFSHLKNFCDEMKTHKTKKRVPFITLEDKDKQSTSGVQAKRRRTETIIDLDDDNQNEIQRKPKEFPPIEIDDDSNDELDNDVIILDENDNTDKENSKKTSKNQTVTKRKRKRHKWKKIKNRSFVANKYTMVNPYNQKRVPAISMPSSILESTDPSSLLEPISSVPSALEPRPIVASALEPRLLVPSSLEHRNPSSQEPGSMLQSLLAPSHEDNSFALEFNQNRIREIEKQIAVLKRSVEDLEEKEVITDCTLSPYIVSEQLKNSIVRLYKELCRLTGTKDTKRHEVRLQVVSGHPEGPVRCLEEFLNANIDDAGNPPFPDMQDVIDCVVEANLKYRMNWSRKQIMNEAHALFTQLGRSMQKRRQRREWKDLITLVKQEVIDPAEEDPVLQAKLEENKRLARKNEDEMLERFAKLEQGNLDPELMMSIERSDSESDDEIVESDNSNPDPPIILNGHISSTVCPPVIPNVNSGFNVIPPVLPYGNSSYAIVPPNLPNGISSNTVDPSKPNSKSDRLIIVPTITGTVGSLLTVSNGNVVIQPAIKFDTLKTSTNSDVSFYSSEFKRFINNSCISDNILINPNSCSARYDSTNNTHNNLESMNSKEKSNMVKSAPEPNQNVLANPNSCSARHDRTNSALKNNLNSKEQSNMVKSAPEPNQNVLANPTSCPARHDRTNSALKNNLNSKEESNMVKSAPEPNQNLLANAESLAKDILSLIQADLSPKNNIAKEQANLESFQPRVQLTNLNLGDLSKSIIVKDKQNGLQSFTHTTQLKSDDDQLNKSNEITGSNELLIADNLREANASISKDGDKETSHTVNTDTSPYNDGVVKPEPLDIPGMLEELGECYTATIFDIEDPFLIIEISDSSESEDEEV